MWDLSSPTRDRTPAMEAQSLNHRTARKVPPFFDLFILSNFTHSGGWVSAFLKTGFPWDSHEGERIRNWSGERP